MDLLLNLRLSQFSPVHQDLDTAVGTLQKVGPVLSVDEVRMRLVRRICRNGLLRESILDSWI
jgi:hypothetical protein